jgi:hypothetical protein
MSALVLRAFALVVLLTAAGCSGQSDRVKMSVDGGGGDAYKAAKVGVNQPL